MNNLDSSQELQRLRAIIQDREKTIKKASEEHKKELGEQKRAKQNAEENLNSAIQENTKIKEKETTMYEIMEGLRKLLDLKDKDNTEKSTIETDANEKPEVEVIDGAVGGAIPKANQFRCERCKFSTTNMNILNKHIRVEHLTTTFPCVDCDFQAKSLSDLRIHQKTPHNQGFSSNSRLQCEFCNFVSQNQEILSKHKLIHSTESPVYPCNKCSFKFTDKTSLSEHINTQHSHESYTCEHCHFVSEDQSSLYMHERNIHQKQKYQCSLCTNYFTKPENLEEHKASKHNIGLYPCNDCGFKAKSFGELDRHIEHEHVYTKQNKNIDIRDLTNRVPCDPYHPNHTTDCCDRGYYRRSGSEERRSRGQCRYWIQGRCNRGDSCRFSHINFCKYQDQCLNYQYCGLLHNSEQKPFLASRKRFIFREEDFPRLERKL